VLARRRQHIKRLVFSPVSPNSRAAIDIRRALFMREAGDDLPLSQRSTEMPEGQTCPIGLLFMSTLEGTPRALPD
jgi:hypothetical protein